MAGEFRIKAVRMTAATTWGATEELTNPEDLLANASESYSPTRFLWDEGDVEEEQLVLARYRARTIQILRRQLRLSIEMGRLPSALGNLNLRGRISSYATKTFEDMVIFVHDVERCLGELDGFSQRIILLLILQEHTAEATARMTHSSVRSVRRGLDEALDEVTRRLLERGILPAGAPVPRACREGSNGVSSAEEWRGEDSF